MAHSPASHAAGLHARSLSRRQENAGASHVEMLAKAKEGRQGGIVGLEHWQRMVKRRDASIGQGLKVCGFPLLDSKGSMSENHVQEEAKRFMGLCLLMPLSLAQATC